MAAIPLKIVLHGLIALVPIIGPGGADHMMALLIDGSNQGGEECAMSHSPIVSFLVAEDSRKTCRSVYHCNLVGDDLCECGTRIVAGEEIAPLAGKEFSLEVKPEPHLRPVRLPEVRPRELPADVTDAGSFGYLVNLSQPPFNMTLNPAYLEEIPSALPPHLVGRVIFPFTAVTSCALAKRLDQGVANIHAFSFRPMGSNGRSDEWSQAMAQAVVASLEVPGGADDEQRVQLKARDIVTGEVFPALTLKPGNEGYLITVSNDVVPPPGFNVDSSCNDGIARHVRHYYQLQSPSIPIAEASRLIPHVRPTRWQSFTGNTPPICPPPSSDPNDRPVCPMATFYRP